jgi:hypothetical protein
LAFEADFGELNGRLAHAGSLTQTLVLKFNYRYGFGMYDRNFSAEEAISLMAVAARDLLEARHPQAVIEHLGAILVSAYRADSVEVVGPFVSAPNNVAEAGVQSQAQVTHILREGAWLREFRLHEVRRDVPQARQIAQSALQIAQQRLETIFQLVTLSTDLAHSQQSAPEEDVETGLRRVLMRGLEWALERSTQQGSAVAVFQIEYASDLTEQERLEVTALLRASLRRVDQVVRLNPDRIVVILEGLLAPDSVLRVEERIAGLFRAQSLSFWAGVALSPAHARTPERLMGLSERALQEVRALGLKGFHHFGAANCVSEGVAL